jgi:hypothetical protein
VTPVTWQALQQWLTDRVTRFLNAPVGRYEQHHPNDLEATKQYLRKGDVILVDGHLRVSVLIKYLTHSPWSHAALYVGDELLRRGGALRALAEEHFGVEAEHVVVEALMEGVVASPLSKYADHNLRICRPHRLRTKHLARILDGAIGAIGWRYDLRNVVDLALHLGGAALLPPQRRRRVLRFGSGAARSVICTSLLGQLFDDVGFPVLPHVSYTDAPGGNESPAPRPLFSMLSRRGEARYHRRHPTLLMPRDFDLSPFFRVVKVDAIGARGLDYERIAWEDAAQDAQHGVEAALGPERPGPR